MRIKNEIAKGDGGGGVVNIYLGLQEVHTPYTMALLGVYIHCTFDWVVTTNSNICQLLGYNVNQLPMKHLIYM